MTHPYNETNQAVLRLVESRVPPNPLAFCSSAPSLSQEAEYFVRRALSMMSRASILVKADRQDAIALLCASRTRLAKHFKRYQIFKHGRIFNPVIASGSASSKVVARGMKVDCMQLGEMFGAYHTRWQGLRSEDWLSYRHDMLATVEVLRVHIESELRAMHQLLMISELYGRRSAHEHH